MPRAHIGRDLQSRPYVLRASVATNELVTTDALSPLRACGALAGSWKGSDELSLSVARPHPPPTHPRKSLHFVQRISERWRFSDLDIATGKANHLPDNHRVFVIWVHLRYLRLFREQLRGKSEIRNPK